MNQTEIKAYAEAKEMAKWKKIFKSEERNTNVFIDFDKHFHFVEESFGVYNFYISSNHNLTYEEFQESINLPKTK